MQTSFKAFLTRFKFPDKFLPRKRPLTCDDDDHSGVVIPRSVRVPLGKYWEARIDPKWMTSILSSVVLYLLAALLGNEWLYLLSSAMLVAAILGAILPFVMLSAIAVDCWLPEKGVASDDAQISVMIRHIRWLGPAKFFVPISAVRARILLARRAIYGFQPHQDLGEQSILLDAGGQSTLLSLAVPHLERGIYKMSHVTVCSSFPFGLVWWTRKIVPSKATGHSDTIVVYPRVWSMRGNFLLHIKGMPSTMGMAFSETLALTQSTSVRGLREFRVGDSLRHIHWPSTARQSKLLVREFDSETLPIFDLYFDLTSNWQSREQFELAVCLAHSLVQFGYERDMLPELFLRPSIDSPELDFLMADLPKAIPPLEMLSEILARVEPIMVNAPVPEITTHRQLLTLVPSTERLLRHSGTKDQTSCPVNLTRITLNDSGDPVSSKAATDVVATIYSEEDLEAL